MATTNNKHLAYRYGYCVNEKCEKSKKDAKGKPEIQQIASHKPLVCADCQKPLHECPPPKKGGFDIKWILIALLALLLLGGLGFGIYKLFGGPKGPQKINLAQKELTMKVGETQVITPTVEPEGEKATFIFKKKGKLVNVTSGGEVTALKAGETTILVKCEENPEIRAICKVKVEDPEVAEPEPEPQPEESEATEPEETKKEEPKAEPEKKKTGTNNSTTKNENKQPSSGTISLSYGKYTGQMSGGYPNGIGRLVYSTTRQINKYDSKKRMAQPGESVQGTFVNGFFTIGKHYDASGNLIETINVGVVDGVYESK